MTVTSATAPGVVEMYTTFEDIADGKVTWQICPHAALELLGGISVAGELRLENSDGHKITEVDYDPAPLVGLRALFTF